MQKDLENLFLNFDFAFLEVGHSVLGHFVAAGGLLRCVSQYDFDDERVVLEVFAHLHAHAVDFLVSQLLQSHWKLLRVPRRKLVRARLDVAGGHETKVGHGVHYGHSGAAKDHVHLVVHCDHAVRARVVRENQRLGVWLAAARLQCCVG